MAKQAFGFIAGYPRNDGFAIVFLSLSNSDLVINCDGFSDTISGGEWTAIGTDHPNAPGNGGDNTGPAQAGFIASTVVTGLNQFTRYDYTVTQNGVIQWLWNDSTKVTRRQFLRVF